MPELRSNVPVKDPIEELVALLSRLPGVGERTATRLAFFLLEVEPGYTQGLGAAIAQIRERVRNCEHCANYSTEALCSICRDVRRDARLVCVVARPQDVSALERGAVFRGHYYVLHGLLSPLDGMGPDQLRLGPLLTRAKQQELDEVILATPLSVEGEATALYLSQQLASEGARCTRIASGVPHGGELEFTDQITLTRAFEGRRAL